MRLDTWTPVLVIVAGFLGGVWVLCGGISAVAIAGLLLLHTLTRARFAPRPAASPAPAA